MTLREFQPMPDDAAWLHFGSIALAAEPAASTLIARAKTAAQSKTAPCLVSYDPNVRPGFASDETIYRRNLDQAMEVADLIKLSRADLAWLRPGMRAEDFARHELTRRAALVVVTHGEDGAQAFTRKGRVTVEAPRVDVADTIGAGDAFMAGLLCALDERDVQTRAALSALSPEALTHALTFATHAAAVACTRPGAVMPWRKEISVLPNP